VGTILNQFFRELRRRNVLRVAGVYAVVGWLLIQIGVAILPTFEAPAWVLKVFIALILTGLPIAIIFAWAFEMTPEGIKPTMAVADGESITQRTGRRLDYVIIAGLALVAVMIIGDRLVPQAGQAASAVAARAVGTGASVAVLPFIDLSPDGDQEYFSDGISEEILNVLVRIPKLKVAGRTSSFSFKGKNDDLREIGGQLGVDHVLEGSVRKSGSKLRITAQLIRSDDGFHMWSQTYDRELTDVFDIQDDIAKSVANELALSLGLKSGESLIVDRTNDIEAYEKYLKARQLYIARGQDNLDAALLLLHEVTARDPGFAPAWALIGNTYVVYEAYQPGYPPDGDWQQWRAIGLAASERAIALDPGNAEAHISRASLMLYSGDLIPGAAELDKAVDLAPDNAAVLDLAAQVLLALGYRQEARSLAHRAVGSDPLVSIYRNTLGNTMAFGGASPDVPDPSAEALRQYAKVREIGPDMIYGYMNAYRTLLKDGRFDEAEAMFQMAVDRGLVPSDAMADVKSALSAARQDEAGAPALRATFASNPNTQGTITILLKDPDLTIALMQPVWDEAYQSGPVLFLLRPASVYQHPAWKAEVRKQGVLALWKSRGFPDWCKPVGADDFVCNSGE
jgi:pentatricopeptide repeat protein